MGEKRNSPLCVWVCVYVCVCVYSNGAKLIENCPVKDAHFEKATGLWTVTIEDSDVTYQVHHTLPPPQPHPPHTMLQGRVLVCADGSTSKLATQLGLVTGPPQATCSRSYVGAGTHSFKADGVMFYPRGILPGIVPAWTFVILQDILWGPL